MIIDLIELLSPAGNLNRLKTALAFGADAVYIGLSRFSLRAERYEFTWEQAREAILYTHQREKKIYVALNLFAQDKQIDELRNTLRDNSDIRFDAYIVSDPGVLSVVKSAYPDAVIHLSTQANTLNLSAVRFWLDQGVTRIVLARELPIESITAICKQYPSAEFEIFVHGAVCLAYSGRCLLSKYMRNRDANQGLCAQPCRWEYSIKSDNSEAEYSIEQSSEGSYILNSHDLCTIGRLPEIVASGVHSLKIEGRMKNEHYIAVTTRVYKHYLSRILNEDTEFDPNWSNELEKISHRPYAEGFYFGDVRQSTEQGGYLKNYDMVGTVRQVNRTEAIIDVRNRIQVGDEVEIVVPDAEQPFYSYQVTELEDDSGIMQDAVHANTVVKIKTDFPVKALSVIRKKIVT